jgi:hypothetical protein
MKRDVDDTAVTRTRFQPHTGGFTSPGGPGGGAYFGGGGYSTSGGGGAPAGCHPRKWRRSATTSRDENAETHRSPVRLCALRRVRLCRVLRRVRVPAAGREDGVCAGRVRLLAVGRVLDVRLVRAQDAPAADVGPPRDTKEDQRDWPGQNCQQLPLDRNQTERQNAQMANAIPTRALVPNRQRSLPLLCPIIISGHPKGYSQ